MVFDWQNNAVHSFTTGAVAGNTGSPADGQSCARSGCHAGMATFQSNMITSDIPSGGYVPGQVYNISATISQAGILKFGFQISPQDNNGNLAGTLVSNPTTKLVGSNKYITHLSTSTAGNGTLTWDFQWVAPSSGSGTVTFYGAFNAANSNSSPSGDDIYLSSLEVSEDLTVSVQSIRNALTGLWMFPNPSNERVVLKHGTDAVLTVFHLNGQRRNTDWKYLGDGQSETNVSTWEPGTYLVQVVENGTVTTLRLVVL